MLLDIVGTPCRNGGRPWRWWASSSCSTGSYPRSCAPRNVLYTSMSDKSLRCLLAPLVCIVWWPGRIVGGIEVVLPKSSTWAHGRTYLFNVDSNASRSIKSQSSWRCVHTRGRGSRWQGDARQGMCHQCLLLPECGDAIICLPLSSRYPSCLWSQSRILEGAAPIISVMVWPLSWRAITSRSNDQCR